MHHFVCSCDWTRMYIRTQSYKAIDGTEGEIWKSEEMKERGGRDAFWFMCAHVYSCCASDLFLSDATPHHTKGRLFFVLFGPLYVSLSHSFLH